MVRPGDAHEGAHQRRHAGAGEERHRVRRRRHRPLPDRAHVLRGRPHRRDARDDPRRDARGAEGRAREAAAVPARRLRRHLPRARGLPGDHPVPRPAAARVPAAHAGAAGGPREEARRRRPRRFTCVSSSCTSSTRCSASAAAGSASTIPEISEMQARAVFEAAAIVQKEGIKVQPEIMIPLVGFKKELDLQLEIVHRVAKDVQAEQKVKLDLPGRHHDRDAARRADGRRDRAVGRVLQLRHQRPDADRRSACRATTRARSCRTTPSSRS